VSALTVFIVAAVVVYVLFLVGGFALCRAASKGDRQMKAALRDRHLRSLP